MNEVQYDAASVPDIRLVVTDMDGTLLDRDGSLPDGFWPVLRRLEAAGIVFVPASGRQHATLVQDFGDAASSLAIIAENGGYVSRGGEEVAARLLEPARVREVLAGIRALQDGGLDAGVVLCGKRSAYVERTDEPFMGQTRHYYKECLVVDDLLTVGDDFLKVAVFHVGRCAAEVAPALRELAPELRVVVSGQDWADVMRPDVNKGVALEALQTNLGVTPAQTMVFGDFLNDLEMMGRAEHSYAMENAHPDIQAAARHTAPPNTERGVVRVLESMLDALEARGFERLSP